MKSQTLFKSSRYRELKFFIAFFHFLYILVLMLVGFEKG